jgi:alkylated DNA repair dioxygenase AlkB
MTTRWLVDQLHVERVQLDDRSWVDVIRGAVPRADEVHDALLTDVTWSQGSVFRYERRIPEPRLSSWRAGTDRHPALVEVEEWLVARYGPTTRPPLRFDGVALALYRDGSDGIAWHRDREMRWLDDTIIAVLTLGASRPFLLKPLAPPPTRGRSRVLNDPDHDAEAIDLHPGSGDLLVMGGACQAAWLHAVPQLRSPCRSRISAQWRWTSKRGRPDANPSYFAPRRVDR